MHLLDQCKAGSLKLQNCHCSACTFIPKPHIKNIDSDIDKPNNLHVFIKILPLGFPLLVQQTVIVEEREQNAGFQYCSYQNPSKDDKKWSLAKQIARSLNIIPSQNVQLYYKNKERILPKYEALNIFSNFKGDRAQAVDIIYVQPYQPRPILRIYYNHQHPMKDNILKQYLGKEEDRFRNPNYQLNEEMLEWIHREYGEEIFCQFLTAIYMRLFTAMTQHTVKQGIFFWALQPYQNNYSSSQIKRPQYDQQRLMGRPRKLPFKPKLLNIRQLDLQLYEKMYSFQDEYNDMIKQKIEKSQHNSISAIKNKAYRARLDGFRNKLKSVYRNEQEAILGKVQEEKQFAYQHDSENMAQMLIPNLAPYKTLREVVSDETAFRKVFGKVIRADKMRVKTQYKTEQTPKKRQLLSPIRRKDRSNSPVKEEYRHYGHGSIQRRYKKLLKTPSTHA